MEKENISNTEQTKKVDTHRKEFGDKVKKYLPIILSEELLILRAQLVTEYYVNSLLTYSLPKEEGFVYSGDQMKFWEKIRKLTELKILPSNEIEAITRLNKLRNKFSHDIDYKVSEGDVDYIGFCFGKNYLKEKYSTNEDGKEQDMKYRLWMLLIDVILAPAIKFWNQVNT